MHLPKLQINDAAAAAGATFLMPTLSISFAISAAALRWTRPTIPPLSKLDIAATPNVSWIAVTVHCQALLYTLNQR